VQLVEAILLNCEVKSSRRFDVKDEQVPLALGDHEVQVWHFNLDIDVELETALAHHLDHDENERASKFQFAKHRRRFIARRAILRTLLSRYAGCDPKAIRFEYGEHGKPRIAGPDSISSIRFSATHSQDLGGVAVTRCCDTGLDFEQILPDGDQALIASTQFSSEENDALLQLPESERREAFYAIWTGKEAYLKGKGLGITAPLNGFTVSVNPEAPQLVGSEIDSSDPEHWSLHRLVVEPGFAACLALNLNSNSVNSNASH
jgi:4'-phosphopantetheinyl transferase